MSIPTELSAGDVVDGKYEVVSLVGRGAMGCVYRARQLTLDRVIALKVLHAQFRNDPEFVGRFMTEALAASRFEHPNSTRVLDFGEWTEGALYIAMELIDGRSLFDVIEQESPLEPGRIVSIMSQALSAVGAAHALGIVHRDLKPENIMVARGKDEEDRDVDVVKVCDFGIAKMEVANETPSAGLRARPKTRAGLIVGTPEYMSPEQAQGDPLDARSDLYSLGVVLYELLSSRLPFNDESPFKVAMKQVHEEPLPPSKVRGGVHPGLEAVCMKALRKAREERWASAREMRAELRAAVAGEISIRELGGAPTQPELRVKASTPTHQGITATPTLIEARPRSPRWPLVLMAGLVVLSASVFALTRRVSPPAPPAPSAAIAVSAAVVAPVDSTPPPIGASEPSATQARVAAPARLPVTHGSAPVAAPPSESPSLAAAAAPEPPPPTAATTVAPPPVVVAAATPPPFDPSRAHADIAHIDPDRVSARSVGDALRHIDLTQCYRSALSQRGAPVGGSATLSLEIDDGRVVHASVKGTDLPPSLGPCIASRVTGARIVDADTGGASATVTLSLVPQ